MLNLAICVDNKRVIGEHPSSIHLIVNSLKTGTIKTRRNTTTILFTLSDREFNRNLIIGNSGIAVSEGVVEVILKLIREGELVEKTSVILVLLSCHEKVVDEMSELDVVSCLLNSIKKSKCSASLRYNCFSILHNIYSKDPTLLEEIRDDETKDTMLSKMLKEDIVALMAKRTAKAILNMLDQPEASSS
ncbi:hypothetical protein LWI29_018290 [Acer saccharum]|uniref:Uncharacterized protein n=1 Tax=Acer saccharum TaxID=4024 RepID=A0AA39VW48_ACESA|nr:hypothetical protein LWI29_018290 [Acer saccharum]